jgi:hypothetical protein
VAPGILAALALASSSALPAGAAAAPDFTFVADPTQPALPIGSNVVGVADLNADGAPDLIVENAQADTIGIMLGNGAGGFGAASSIPLGARPVWVRVADFNDDGHPDLLVPLETKATPREHNLLAEHLEILFGDGHGSFTTGPLIKLPTTGPIEIGDFNGDGNADVVLEPNGCYAEGNDRNYYMLLGDGHGDLVPAPTTAAETNTCFAEAGDFTHDGRSDLVMASLGNGPQDVIVLPGLASGGFGPPIVTPDPQGGYFNGGIADFNGDGTPDLIIQLFHEPSTFDVLTGDGTGHFTASGPYASGAPHLFFTSAVGDFNGDGRADIAALGEGLEALESVAPGGFSPGPLMSLPRGLWGRPYVADVNRDGRPDLILNGQGSVVDVLLNERLPASATLAIAWGVARHPRGRRRRVQVHGALQLTHGAAPTASACSGRVLIRLTHRGKPAGHQAVALSRTCSFTYMLALAPSKLALKRTLTVAVSFAGNTYLAATSARARI